jgi:hypothetical protein
MKKRMKKKEQDKNKKTGKIKWGTRLFGSRVHMPPLFEMRFQDIWEF